MAETLVQLGKIDAIRQRPAPSRRNATRIDTEWTRIRAAIQRLLDQALAALNGAGSTSGTAGAGGIEAGAA